MQIYSHRVNTIELLKETPTKYGVEIDIRSYGNNLILHHDPFKEGTAFTEWLAAYKHAGIILNVKEEGLEIKILELMDKYKITDFFFLDQSFPFLRQTAKSGEQRCSVRISEYENIETVMSLAGMISWVWVDCFTKFPLTKNQVSSLKDAGFKLCIVSPELQGRTQIKEVSQFRHHLESLNIKGDAVCTKYANLWI